MAEQGNKSRRPATERRNPRSRGLDLLSTREILEVINDEDAQVAAAVRRVVPAVSRAVNLATDRLSTGGKLFYVGAGTSGRLGVLDASEWAPTFGVPATLARGIIAGGRRAITRPIEGAEDGDGSGDLQAAGVGPADVVVGISASAMTTFVRTALVWAKAEGCATVLVCCNRTPRPHCADVLINPVTGPEVLTGSTRMKAGTATKMVLNMLSTATMVRLGKVYDNLMVDVKPGSAKLRRRAGSIIAEIGGVSSQQAAALLDKADGNTKAAVAMARLGCSVARARALLRAHYGRLRDVLLDSKEL